MKYQLATIAQGLCIGGLAALLVHGWLSLVAVVLLVFIMRLQDLVGGPK